MPVVPAPAEEEMPRIEIALVPELSIDTPGVKRAMSWKSLMPRAAYRGHRTRTATWKPSRERRELNSSCAYPSPILHALPKASRVQFYDCSRTAASAPQLTNTSSLQSITASEVRRSF